MVTNKAPKFIVIALLILAIVLAGYGVEQLVAREVKTNTLKRVDAFLQLKTDEVEKAELYHVFYGSWELTREETEDIFDLIQAAAGNVTGENTANLTGSAGRGAVVTFFTADGKEIGASVSYDTLELYGTDYAVSCESDRDSCDAIEAFYLEQVNQRTTEIVSQKEKLTNTTISSVVGLNLKTINGETYSPTTQECKDILRYLSLSLNTNTLEKVLHISNNISYYIVDLPHINKSGNEVAVYLEFPDGETIIMEASEGVIFLNDIPYLVNAELNAALEQICREIYNSATA